MRILIKYATRGRPELFKARIKNIHETIGINDFEIIVSVDSNDLTMLYIDSFCSTYPNVKLIWGHNHSKVSAINRDIEHAKPWDLLINFSDDMVFVQQNWGPLMIDLIKMKWGESTDFFAHFNDGFVKEKLPTMSIMGWEYLHRTGTVYNPEYKSVSCDAEAMFVAMMLGKHHYFENQFFSHMHPANAPGIVGSDSTYMLNDKFEKEDTETYFRRKSKLFYVNNPTIIPFNPHDRS